MKQASSSSDVKYLVETNILNEKLHRNYEINGKIITLKYEIESFKRLSTFKERLIDMLRDVFLPIGFPHSVRQEYLAYQYWDGIQGLSSYLRGVLTSKQILIASGVGDSNASALSAVLIWAFRDGIGMISSLLLAYFCSNMFEINIKEWRLSADILNNIGLVLDMISPLFPDSLVLIVSLSTICKSFCGLIAGSTKARISSHFLQKGTHIGDLAAKENTQETAVALLGIVIGMLITKLVGNNLLLAWLIFITLLFLHVWANYKLIRVLVLDILNPQRCYLLIKHESTGILNPKQISTKESLWLPLLLQFQGPIIGYSMQDILNTFTILKISIRDVYQRWEKESFVICMDGQGRIHTFLKSHCTDVDQIKGVLISYYIFYKFERSITNPNLKVLRFYEYLFHENLISEVNTWYDNSEINKLESYGWNIESLSSVGLGPWRLSSKID